MNSYRKGSNGERELAAELTRLLGVECHRAASPWLPGILRPDVRLSAGMIHIEVKRREHVSLPAALRQAKADAQGKVAVVCHRSNHEPWMLTVALDDLPALAEEVWKIVNHDQLPTVGSCNND
jgi:hypothetical protein